MDKRQEQKRLGWQPDWAQWTSQPRVDLFRLRANLCAHHTWKSALLQSLLLANCCRGVARLLCAGCLTTQSLLCCRTESQSPLLRTPIQCWLQFLLLQKSKQHLYMQCRTMMEFVTRGLQQYQQNFCMLRRSACKMPVGWQGHKCCYRGPYTSKPRDRDCSRIAIWHVRQQTLLHSESTGHSIRLLLWSSWWSAATEFQRLPWSRCQLHLMSILN